MDKKHENDWEKPVSQSQFKDKREYNLEKIYDRAHSELSLQQSKRDQIITIYLALCSFLLPFALGEQISSLKMKGIIFILLGVVGILFSLVTVRYREYKEVYWLCCQTLSMLQNFKHEDINKSVVQRSFYHCLEKKGNVYLKRDGDNVTLKRFTFVKRNLYSAETIHFAIIALMTSFINGLGAKLICETSELISILSGILVGLLIFLFLFAVYFRNCMRIYYPLKVKDRKNDAKLRDRAFNSAFSKAWFLHFYYDIK